ncbi:MAG: ParB/RepB/Spo0J family partition protein [Treponema sp.]|jgi:ParB family chromosome partitioning protein|nr:ParB/RepB/Spo0J family partition protein [Treponema sp.]
MAKLDIQGEVAKRTGTTDSKIRTDGGSLSSLPTRDIPLKQVVEKDNVRRDYEGIKELSANIREYGLQQPVVVYPDKEGYILIDGHRRYRAYQQLAQEAPEQFQTIPCIVSNDKDILIRQLVSNIQRSDLSQTEIYQALMTLKEQNRSESEIAVIMGKDEKTVKNLFAVVKKISDDDYLKEYISGKGTIQEITEVIAIKDSQKRNMLLEQRENGTLANRKALRDEAKRVKQEERKQRRQERKKAGEDGQEENPAGGIETESKTRKMTIRPDSEKFRIELVLKDKEAFDMVLARLKEIANQSSIACEYLG